MISFRTHALLMEASFSPRGLHDYLVSIQSILSSAERMEGEFSGMDDAEVESVLGRMIGQIERITTTMPVGTDPVAVQVGKRILSVGARATALRSAIRRRIERRMERMKRISDRLQGAYDLRFAT